jgi:hypothetical protein
MGYRSDVVLAIDAALVPQFMATLAKSPEARSFCFSHSDEVVKDYCEPGCLLFRWDDVKWYDSFEEVAAIVDFLGWAEAERVDWNGTKADGDNFFRFVRIGESYDDIDVIGYGFDHIQPTRSIDY